MLLGCGRRYQFLLLVVLRILGVAWHLSDVLHHITYLQIIPAGKGYFEPLLDLAGSHCNSFKPFVLERGGSDGVSLFGAVCLAEPRGMCPIKQNIERD